MHSHESPTPRLQRLRALFDAANEVPLAQREALVRKAAADEPTLADEVLTLLRDADGVRSTDLRAWAQEPPAASEPPLPTAIGPYRILERVGRGGMGVVYRAERADLQAEVAVKVCQRPAGTTGIEFVQRFQLEARALAAMNHRYIARVHDAGTTPQDEPYFVMEFLAGQPLTKYCDSHKLTVPARLSLLQQVCDGVQHAHAKFVVHRDLKPDNVIVVDDGGVPVPKIVDFGLAKVIGPGPFDGALGLTGADRRLGTLLYMSPEQVEGRSHAVDARSDVYSLGVILYELLCGQLPFSAASLERLQQESGRLAVLRRLVHDEVVPPSRRVTSDPDCATAAGLRSTSLASLRRRLDGDLDQIVRKAMAKEPEDRYAAASDLAADLGRHLEHLPVLAGPPSSSTRLRKFVRRYRPQVAIGALLLAALATAVVALAFGLHTARRATVEAVLREADMAFRDGQWQRALDAYERALVLDDSDPVLAQLQLVECLDGLHRFDESQALLRRIPVATNLAHEAKRLLLVGAIGVDRVAARDAGVAELSRALTMHTESEQLHARPLLSPGDVGYLQAMLAPTLEGIVAALEAGLAREPMHRRANLMLPLALLFAGRMQAAVDAGSRCLARWGVDPDAEFVLAMARSASNQPAGAAGEAAGDEPSLARAMGALLELARRQFAESLLATCAIALGEPPKLRFPPVLELAKCLETLGRVMNTDDRVLDQVVGRMPIALLTDYGGMLQRVRGVDGKLRVPWPAFKVEPRTIVDLLASLPAERADAALLLIRSETTRVLSKDAGERAAALVAAAEADLEEVAAARGPMGWWPEVARLRRVLRICYLHGAWKVQGLTADAVRDLEQQAVATAREALAGPPMYANEARLFARMCSTYLEEPRLAVALLERAHGEHPADVANLVLLAELEQGDAARASYWWHHVLAQDPSHALAKAKLLQSSSMVEASPTPAAASVPKK